MARTVRPSGPRGPGRVRIIAGRWKGRRLEVPPVAGLRPTPDRLRETLFNWLAPVLPGARVLDLFAGSGALGLEALSRGAARAVLVERHPRALRVLRQTCQRLGAADAEVVPADARRYLEHGTGRFDIVFLDPPYQSGLLGPCLALLAAGRCLAPGARVYVEAGRAPPPVWPPGWEVRRRARAGDACGYLLQVPDDSPPAMG